MKKRSVRCRASVTLGLLLCAAVFALSLSSCVYRGYRGERADLYTVAMNNIFCASGHVSNGERLYDSVIEVVETDEYGRTLFFYDEYYDDSTDPQIRYGMAFVIMQKAEAGYAYYYQDDCYTPYFDTVDEYDQVMRRVDPMLIEELKARNDWNQEINEDRCTKAKISGEKPEGKLRVCEYDLDEIIYPYAKANGYQGTDRHACRYILYCNADTFGKELYYVYCLTSDQTPSGETEYGHYAYAVIVQPDGSFSETPLVEIPDPTMSYELIRELKRQNWWDLAEPQITLRAAR